MKVFRNWIVVVMLITVSLMFVGCGGRPKHPQTLDGDFLLTIFAEQTTVRRGENFRINVSLKNQSDGDIEIVYFVEWVRAHIPNWNDTVQSFDFPEYPQRLVVNSGDSINTTWLIGYNLPRGRHNLIAETRFQIFQDGVYSERMEIWSNTISLRVRR
ncbi:MAG: hypothetical protein FWE38_02275 [Firmicutes bacterium]|nr:hypothetical protein [Bacillota bacterium]